MGDVATLTVDDGIGIIEIDSPPVNALGIVVRRALDEGFRAMAADDAVSAIVLICGGRTFFAGADISEFGKPPQAPMLPDLLDRIETTGKPVVAAIHGTALGGGYETALVCSHRIAVPSAKVGLPEVHLGLLPGAGGTQRLPRIVGAEAALEIMTKGAPVPAKRALDLGMVDALAGEGRLREDAVAFARELVSGGAPAVRVRDRSDRIADTDPALFDAFRQVNARAFRGFRAPENIVRAVEAAVTLPFDEGMARERELFMELMASSESAAQRYYFFAERETAKLPDVPADTPTRTIERVGVIGAGTMGGGIAMNFLNAGIAVTLVETGQEALDRGLEVIRRNFAASAAKGRMAPEAVDQRMALVTPALDLAALGTADLVIEAVYEEMAVKQDVFARLDAVAKPGALLASNTSYLDIDAIAAATARPQDVLGLHFFSPANVMRLLEVVRGARTAPDAIATAMKLARRIAKVPVLSRVGHGFIANRVMTVRGQQANAMILEGTPPEAIDRAIVDFGFAMGPFQMADLVGLDVIGRGSTTRTVAGDLVARGRLGQKQGGGFYDFDAKRRGTPSSVAAEVIADVAEAIGIARRPAASTEEIVERLLYVVVNEGAKVLEEGIALRASDIDVACVLGYNWPVYTGGPMFWADTVGLPRIVARLAELEAEYGPAFAVSPLLARRAKEGGKLTR